MTEVRASQSLTDPVAQELLNSNIPARMAYCWHDGSPRVVPTWFHWDGEKVIMCSPPGSPKLRALHDGDPVALTIDSNEFPYKALSIRGSVRVELVSGVPPEYVASATRYFGEQQGAAWVAQFPPDVAFWRFSVNPELVRILDFESRFPSALSN